ncbi:hypothetical protein BDV95DRAFT_568931 [Massariosphaeria phaeospora]|uniref:Uncharacterized protein n=1 Tax=Massariosphaeria phaeospora TaxID=100035 RepID=A0A7C8MRD5_9PLEO|nr:hypothetical protein BDV95DRAFT_568931 [Massariosphaeria phaeospora]
MQVHAVLDSERAVDSTGRKLPWAYEYADPDHAQRRMPEEKGPFGKARKRGSTRSKTATPGRGGNTDQAQLDNLRVIDDIFTRTVQVEKERRPANPTASLPVSASAPNLLDAGGLAGSFQAGASTNTTKEPTEAIIYGYGNDVQWAAIEFYEKASGGLIYEEYSRQPPHAKYSLAFTPQRTSMFRSLSRSALRKVNEFLGGEHWIKVTFDSPEAAGRAFHYSPHVIQGYTVFAEPYRGIGPNADKAIRATAGGASSLTASPNTVSSVTLPSGTSQSSATASSATATGSVPASMPPRLISEPLLHGSFPLDPIDYEPAAPVVTASAAHSIGGARATSTQLRQPGRSTLRIRDAKPAVLLPPEKAFLPAAPRWQQTFGSWPVIGWVIGSGHGIIGDHVPRNEVGQFDSVNASLYWRVWYMVDTCFGTDFCGVKDAEYEE